MYAIAVKETPRSSWYMRDKVYTDREKVDAIIRVLSSEYYKVQRVFFEEDI